MIAFCTNPELRKTYPNRSKFLLYTAKENGVYVVKNRYDDIFYSSEINDELFKMTAQKLSDTEREKLSELEYEYYNHKNNNPELYGYTYDEANFTHKALFKGFEPQFLKDKFHPYTNWFGVSCCAYKGYSPEEVLKRDKKVIILSLQGFLVPSIGFDLYPELAKSMSIKYLCFKDGDSVLYETYTGELPSSEFIENFIK